ncbi:MAG TPA: efflux RND transporter periplasmic adaptor subunit, partial [Minicystis sp.]|nr:efflux RND transporter periplasmic adaptor subunit [Minicystis sp.]
IVAAALVAVRALQKPAAPVVRFETLPLDRGPFAAKVTATGQTSAIVTVQVGSQVSGRIDSLKVDFNSPVKKGQVVATIDPSLFNAAVGQASANLKSARAAVVNAVAQRAHAEKDLARARLLFDEGLASRADLDAAEATAEVGRAQVTAALASVSQAEAALDQAKLNLSYTTVVSPIDGVVISRNVDVGQTVAATLQAPTLFTIAQDLRKMQVDTNVAEADIGKVRQGMVATFTVDAYPGRTFSGSVRQVRDAATTVQNVVTYDAVIDVDNDDLALKPGMTANATFVYAERGDVLRVPNAALRFKPDAATVTAMTAGAQRAAPPKPAADERVVWTEAGGHAAPHLVKIGISDGTSTEVTAGDVQPGEAAVTEAVVTSPGKRP